jgi:hypothetical protein
LRFYLESIHREGRIIAALPFLTDFQDGESWASFDTAEAHNDILTMVRSLPPIMPSTPEVIHLPHIELGTPPVEPQQPQQEKPMANDKWERSIAFVLRMEGGLSTDPNDPGNYVNGRFVGTKYGISAASYPNLDIPNITIEQAKSIYFNDYWVRSGANLLSFPLCLAVFDLAVNGGVGRAEQALNEAGHDFVKFMAWRIAWYTRINNFERYGRAWIRRCAELMNEAVR